jgi:hypothetical protein
VGISVQTRLKVSTYFVGKARIHSPFLGTLYRGINKIFFCNFASLSYKRN